MTFRPIVTPLIWFLALGATLVTGVTPVRAANPPEPPKGLSAPQQATPMPAFQLSGSGGSKVRSTDLRDKVTVIRFWATW